MSREEFDEDERENDVQPRRQRVVESTLHREAGMSVFTKVLLVLGGVVVICVGVVSWILASTLRPIVQHASDALGTFGPLWNGLLILAAISLLLGLIRRVGAIKFFEDIIAVGLRVHEHFAVKTQRLHADKLGNYPIPLDAQGNPIWVVPGNAAHPMQMMPPLASGSISKRAATRSAATQVEMEQQQGYLQQPTPQSQGLLPNGTPLHLLGAPSASAQQQHEGGDITRVYTAQTTKLPEEDMSTLWGNEDATRMYAPKVLPGQYSFTKELALFTPSRKSVFMGRSVDGPILIEFPKHRHIVFAGPTRVGKSTIMRMLFAQYISINVDCYLCDSHYIPYNPDNGLDWTPIEQRLRHAPFRKAHEAADFLRWLALEELETRKDLAYRGQSVGRPIVVAIEELAGLIDASPEVGRYIGILLRQSLKYWIVLILVAQDLLVKSIGLDSGMREQIGTGYYGGGDINTAKIALDLQNGEKTLDETGLGNGVVYVRTPQNRATRVRIPWPDNESVQMLCDASILPVHELVREPLDEDIPEERVYEHQEENEGDNEVGTRGTNIREFPVPVSKVGKRPNPMQPHHLTFVLQNLHLSDTNVAKSLGVTQHYANKIKKVITHTLQNPDMSDAEMAKELSILEEDATLVKSVIRDAQKAETVNE